MPQRTPNPRRKPSGPKTSPATIIFALVLISCLSVTTGYIVTKQLVYPYVLKQDMAGPDKNATSGGIVIDENEIPPVKTGEANSPSVVESPVSIDEVVSDINDTPEEVVSKDPMENSEAAQTTQTAGTDAGTFAVQVGNLSTKEGANELVSDLKGKGLTCTIKEIDGKFKVISGSYATKDEARAHLPAIQTVVADAFVTTLK